MYKRYLVLFSAWIYCWPLEAQHTHMPGMEHHTMQIPDTTMKDHSMDHHGMQMPDTPMKDHSMGGMNMEEMNMGGMNSALSVNLPMSRNGSGTSWLPDSTPMYAYMVHAGDWMVMFHGDIFPRYNSQDIFRSGSRGGGQWDAPDMLMAMVQRTIGRKSLLHINLMLSTDALITGGNGYPLIFQTGESWKGKPLVDRQHPHDLFSELSVSYAYSFSKKTDAYVYAGYPGEPALGPATFMHRPSGEFMPDAPISHHWVDATHITFGVATVGLRVGKCKLEASSFTGREPDENRYNFDKPSFDSWSGRFSVNPSGNWALQVSHSYLKSPEQLHPDENINRTTASAICVYPFHNNHYFTATAVWGMNAINGQPSSNALLAEAMIRWARTDVYTRFDWVQKTTEELGLQPIFTDPGRFDVTAATVGGSYDLIRFLNLTVAAGAQFTFNFPPAELKIFYGNNPISGEVYLHIFPQMMR